MAKKKKNKKSPVGRAAQSLQNVLGGGFLANKRAAENLPFLFFLALLALIYIGNSFYAEKNIRRIEKLQKEVKELRYEHIYTKSKLMSKIRQSEVAESLTEEGIKESRTPPGKIKIEKD